MSENTVGFTGYSLATLAVAVIMCLLITVLLVVLLIICIKFRRKSSNVVESAMELSMSKAEASKFYTVESNTTDGDSKRQQRPPLVTVSLHPLSHDLLVDMEVNPHYHQLRMEDNTGVVRPGSTASSTTTNQSSTSCVPLLEPSNKTSPVLHHINHSSFAAAEKKVEESFLKPSVRQDRGASNSLDVKMSQNFDDNQSFSRALSDTNLSSQDSLYGPLYGNRSTQQVTVAEISRCNVVTERALGMGQFGQVQLARTRGLSAADLGLGDDCNRLQTYEVAVKFLRQDSAQRDQRAFQKEVKYMSQFRHKNVIKILAVCWQEQQFIVLEYMKNGDLQTFLQRYDSVNMGQETYSSTISYHHLIDISLQIADALHYLSSRKFIHRDLACRNCLVGENFLVKVADFGLSRNLYDSCYYRFHGSALLPIRWMAPECFHGRFSEKTDVWAFGVTMWEIFNLCRQRPYGDMSDERIVQEALGGTLRLLDKPECCRLDVYEVIKSCLRNSSNDRPGFGEVYAELVELLNTAAATVW